MIEKRKFVFETAPSLPSFLLNVSLCHPTSTRVPLTGTYMFLRVNILTPLLWPSRCVFLVLLMLNRRPGGSLCCVMAFFIASYQHLLRTPTHQSPRPPSAWCGFRYHISSPTLLTACNSTATNSTGSSNSTELYNRSTPTRSLKSNV